MSFKNKPSVEELKYAKYIDHAVIQDKNGFFIEIELDDQGIHIDHMGERVILPMSEEVKAFFYKNIDSFKPSEK